MVEGVPGQVEWSSHTGPPRMPVSLKGPQTHPACGVVGHGISTIDFRSNGMHRMGPCMEGLPHDKLSHT